MTDEGADFGDVLKDAQQQGYAEADPTFDIEGIDTAHKLAILVSLCYGTQVDCDDIYLEGISQISSTDIQFARQFGYKIKLLGYQQRGQWRNRGSGASDHDSAKCSFGRR